MKSDEGRYKVEEKAVDKRLAGIISDLYTPSSIRTLHT